MSRYQSIETESEKEKAEKLKKARIKALVKKEEELVNQFVLLEKQHVIILKNKKQVITEWAAVLEELANLKYYQWPVYTISNYISHVSKDRGYPITREYIIEVLDSKYKDPNLSYAGTISAEVRESKAEVEPRPIIKIPQLIEHNITYGQMTADELKVAYIEYRVNIKKAETNKKSLEKHAESRGIALPKDQLPNTMGTQKDDPKVTIMSKALHKMNERMQIFTNSIEELEKKVKEFPPEYDKGVQEEISSVIDIFCDQIIDPFNSFLQPLKDEKWSQSWPKWWKTQILNIDHGKHAAATMSSGISHSGQRRGLTREQVGDRAIKSYEEAIKFSRAVQMFLHMNEYHAKFIEPRILDRKIKMSDKLSNSA